MSGTTAFPAALDTFPAIGPSTQEDATGIEHDVVHENVHASVLALQAKVGIDGSVVSGSLDYKVASITAAIAALGTSSALNVDTDNALTANSDTRVPSQKAVKSYVLSQLDGRSWKQAVRAASTANVTLASGVANGSVLDGVTLATGDRVLLKNQTTASENGIYIVAASGAPVRSTDADSGAELVNATCEVSEGTVNADLQYTCSTNAPITVGTTALVFIQSSSSGASYTADESTLHLSGTMFAVKSGGITSTEIADKAVTLAKQADMATASVMYRKTAGSGAPEVQSLATLKADLGLPVGAAIFADFDGGNATLAGPAYCDVVVPWNCTITKSTVLADAIGSLVLSVWVDTYANFPPTVADNICGSAPPTLTSAASSQDASLTGWTTSLTAGTVIRIGIVSATTIKRASLCLQVTKT